MAATIALTEQSHKIQALEDEVELREKEMVREELGSDFESEDEERPDVTQVSKSVTSGRDSGVKHLAIERWVERAHTDRSDAVRQVEKPIPYSEMSDEKRLEIERRFKETFNITQVTMTRPSGVDATMSSLSSARAQTQVTFSASTNPATSTAQPPASIPNDPVPPKSRALVVGKEVHSLKFHFPYPKQDGKILAGRIRLKNKTQR